MICISSISKRWRELSGDRNWASLLDPLDFDLRRYIIHYGQLSQATYDTFNSQKSSRYGGDSRFREKDMFAKVGLDIANPFRYKVTKFLYAMSGIKVPEAFIVKSLLAEPWDKDSNWIGFVAVTTDRGMCALGRRDIVISWRGTIQKSEWESDFNFPLVSASKILGDEGKPMVHAGWLAIYTSSNAQSVYNKISARQQVLCEVQRLLEHHKDEEISITVTGHSLGAALGTLSAVDIVANGINKRKSGLGLVHCPVTAFVFASPRIGDSGFHNVFQSQKNLHLLRVRNAPDIIPNYPLVGYKEVGEELHIDNSKSPYLESPGNAVTWHNLEGYLHGVAGSHAGGFHLVVNRDIALVNKSSNMLKDKFMVPTSWWCMRNKGMVQQKDGSWKLDDHDV